MNERFRTHMATEGESI